MVYKLVITQKAEQDIDNIARFIVNELCNIPAAIHLLDEIGKRYGVLTEMPRLHSECQHPLLKAAQYCKAVIDGYLMIYRVDDEKSRVIIERYFSNLEDYCD